MRHTGKWWIQHPYPVCLVMEVEALGNPASSQRGNPKASSSLKNSPGADNTALPEMMAGDRSAPGLITALDLVLPRTTPAVQPTQVVQGPSDPSPTRMRNGYEVAAADQALVIKVPHRRPQPANSRQSPLQLPSRRCPCRRSSLPSQGHVELPHREW